jgi:hypothetical protein
MQTNHGKYWLAVEARNQYIPIDYLYILEEYVDRIGRMRTNGGSTIPFCAQIDIISRPEKRKSANVWFFR